MTREELEEILKNAEPIFIACTRFDSMYLLNEQFCGVTFNHCTFWHVRFQGSDFGNACFQNCDFIKCDFEDTRFNSSVFIDSHFSGCDGLDKSINGLSGVTFVNTTAFECGDKWTDSIPMNCPSSGSFIGWKACDVKNTYIFATQVTRGPIIVKLQIPAKAKRSSGITTSRKCRASEAKVLGFYTPDGKPIKKVSGCVVSAWDPSFEYVVGETVKPRFNFDTSRNECASGIHFFLDFKAAVDYANG